MLKYKNVKFLQIFAQKRTLLSTFCQISVMFLHVFAPFFSCPFYPNHPCCHSTSVCSSKTNIPARRTKKNRNFPPFLKIKKFHFSIMLICANKNTTDFITGAFPLNWCFYWSKPIFVGRSRSPTFLKWDKALSRSAKSFSVKSKLVPPMVI